MSERIGDVVVIKVEPDRPCETCGTVTECRPYGAGGTQICFKCAMSTPEARAETKRQMDHRLFGDPLVESKEQS